MIEISNKELYRLKEKGLTDKQIQEYYIEQGIKVTEATINRRLKKIYRTKEENININENVKNLLLSGMCIKNYCERNKCKESTIKDIIRKLKIIAENSKKSGKQWVPDEEFIEVIRVLESTKNVNPKEWYRSRINTYLQNGMCKNGKIDLIKDHLFSKNNDLMVFVLNGYSLRYSEKYDKKVWNNMKLKYEEKIDKYLERLNNIEKNRAEKRKEKTQDSESFSR